MQVLFAVDHKYRDLPALSLIGYFLRKQGVTVYYASLPQSKAIAEQLKPDLIVMPKPFNVDHFLSPDTIATAKIMVISTEGNIQADRPRTPVLNELDAYFFWNHIEKTYEENSPGLRNSDLRVVGNPRLDFLHPRNKGLRPNPTQLYKRWNLDASQPTLTITSKHVLAGVSDSLRASMRNFEEETAGIGYIFDHGIRRDCEARASLETILERIFSQNPNFNVVVKPHPNENLSLWYDFQKRYPRLCLVTGCSIEDLFVISDFNISTASCTTTGEARIAGIPTAEIITDAAREYSRSDEDQLPDSIIRTPEDSDCIYQYLETNNPELLQPIANEPVIPLSDYVKKYYHRADGHCCYAYAVEILDLLMQPKRTIAKIYQRRTPTMRAKQASTSGDSTVICLQEKTNFIASTILSLLKKRPYPHLMKVRSDKTNKGTWALFIGPHKIVEIAPLSILLGSQLINISNSRRFFRFRCICTSLLPHFPRHDDRGRYDVRIRLGDEYTYYKLYKKVFSSSDLLEDEAHDI